MTWRLEDPEDSDIAILTKSQNVFALFSIVKTTERWIEAAGCRCYAHPQDHDK